MMAVVAFVTLAGVSPAQAGRSPLLVSAGPALTDGQRFVVADVGGGTTMVIDTLRHRKYSLRAPPRCQRPLGSLDAAGSGEAMWSCISQGIRGHFPVLLNLATRAVRVPAGVQGLSADEINTVMVGDAASFIAVGRRWIEMFYEGNDVSAIKYLNWRTGSIEPDSARFCYPLSRTPVPDPQQLGIASRPAYPTHWRYGVTADAAGALTLRQCGHRRSVRLSLCRTPRALPFASGCGDAQLASGVVTWIDFDLPTARLTARAYNVRTRRRCTWELTGSDVLAYHTRNELILSARTNASSPFVVTSRSLGRCAR
jgi:hypothetical protein